MDKEEVDRDWAIFFTRKTGSLFLVKRSKTVCKFRSSGQFTDRLEKSFEVSAVRTDRLFVSQAGRLLNTI